MAKYLVLSISQAERYDLVVCTCGWDRHGCDHRGCKEFTPAARAGRLIDVPAITEHDLAEAIKETA